MTVSEKAKLYAEGKITESLTKTVEQAYIEGYNAGYNDALVNNKVPEVAEGKICFVDLHLPQETFWASDYLRGKDGEIIYCTYDEACQLGIPSDTQFNDLMNKCKVSLILPEDSSKNEKLYKIGVQDNYICLSSEKGFWVKSYFDSDSNFKHCVKSLNLTTADRNERLPVILIKYRYQLQL